MIPRRVRSIKDSIKNTNVLNKAYIWKLSGFRPKNEIYYENRKYIVKTIESPLELEKALSLRYEVFYKELIKKRSIVTIDFDRFDLISDHIVIIDKADDQIIGTYRVICSNFSNTFYSETEFDIENLKKSPFNKMELGRACVHKDYRNGMTLALLWKGISMYMESNNIKYLFGCSSVNTTNILEISLIYKYIKDLHLSGHELRVYPKNKFKPESLNTYIDVFEKFNTKADAIEDFIPPLLKTYLKAGSKICGEPALDRKFKCVDFFTVLDSDLMAGKFEKRYKIANG
ncbi:MAG: GNAT family N-acetyltransferase [Candidatus Dadabacteria bacterium]|nr:GNAT family N-acetyltransferase [Candidatus Dadabacteria bacterium]NIS08638.1 GNAT family N-acetyltransferase [Candidatus Dadabacteria bacterium]NIV42472.1 GNAT family N-acetyltransferase [Candidatus Dadabacteria bacterium]NIX15354.1 GNAT family N-acetyltransferase [Candidatus Dadabacteria bacterium]NIY22013.1 GNAT family N-acetyltransferase [Candidatus Dadabacteria bacterium]